MLRSAKAVLIVLLAGAVAPAATNATAYAQFTLRQPSSCAVGTCRVVLDYDTSALTAPVSLAIVAARGGRSDLELAAALCQPPQRT